jgi:two-component system chemotaxis response regulator CheB
MAKSISVLVVDDSAFMRKILTDILESDNEIKVAATAKDGREALEKVRTVSPDVITLDVEMPAMDGLTCLKELQKITDVPVIMLSGLTTSGAKATIESLEAGAIDFITKPTGLFDIAGEAKKKEIIEKIRMAKSVRRKVSRAIRAETARVEPVRPVVRTDRESKRSTELKTLVAIGTSTGGPKALQEVIPYIPGDIPAAVVIVQHMPPGFTKSLADRLNTLSDLSVKEAEHDEVIKPGYAYIAPGDYHMEVQKTAKGVLKIKLTQEPPVGGHRPAVNVMMNSVAETGFRKVIGVIMTGMGADGSKGIVNIKNSNKGVIISQDEKSCVVYGMPKSAVNTGVVDEVVPLKDIAEVIVKYLGVE